MFSGEYLYYKVYNLNLKSNTLSNISKVAYIELINSDKEVIFKHKIILNSGTGQGDFYITSSIPSGNYKLIAYTRWMRNFGKSNYFQADVSIINPFQTNLNFVDTLKTQNLSYKTTTKKNHKSNYIEITLNKEKISNRELIQLSINSIQGSNSYGNYSISVKKIDQIRVPDKPNSKSFKNNLTSNIETLNNSLVYLPEMRGKLISGSIIDKKTNKIVAFKPISLSIPGNNPIFKTSRTNAAGKFYFNIYDFYENENAILEVMDKDFYNYDIKIHEDLPMDYSNVEFNNFKISNEMKPIIKEKSIRNQVENAYSNLKKDLLITNDSISKFYNGFEITYNLDTYTRFKTVKETVVEIIDELKVQKVNGKDKLLLKSYTFSEKDLLSLIIVDGNVLKNHDDLINYDSRKIEKISVINSKYRYGGKVYDGIIDVTTKNKNFIENLTNSTAKTINISKPLDKKVYFTPNYKENTFERIPDYRTQLFWEPNCILDKNKKTFSFYTSDYNGVFEISIEGFTKEGIPVSIRKILSVK